MILPGQHVDLWHRKKTQWPCVFVRDWGANEAATILRFFHLNKTGTKSCCVEALPQQFRWLVNIGTQKFQPFLKPLRCLFKYHHVGCPFVKMSHGCWSVRNQKFYGFDEELIFSQLRIHNHCRYYCTGWGNDWILISFWHISYIYIHMPASKPWCAAGK